MCSHPSGETWARNFGRDVEAGVLPGEDGLTELQRVPVDDDRGQQVEAGEPVVLSFGSVSHAAHFPQGGASSFWRGYAASLRRIWLGRMVPAAMVAATRRMSAQFLSIRSTFTLPPTRRRKVLRDARAFEPVEPFRRQTPDAWDELVTEDRARCEDMVGEAPRVGVLLADAPARLVSSGDRRRFS